MIKNLTLVILQLAILLEYQNIKIIFAKGYNLNWPKDVFVITIFKNSDPWIQDYKKSKMLFLGHMLYVILKAKKLLGRFTKNN